MMNTTHKRHNGYILIMLLIVIAIGLLIYYMDIIAITGGYRQPKTEKPEDQPWAKENLIRESNQPVRPPQKASPKLQKPVITKTLVLSGQVSLKDAKRGQIVLTIEPDGAVEGTWQCRYSYTHASYTISASFRGNTDVTQEAPDDPTKLFLIAKGDYVQQAANLDSGEVTRTQETLYISGWLDSSFTASGRLSLTTDKRAHTDYNWTAQAALNK